MIVTRLKLTNLRSVETAEFHFQPGVNLIFGVNGVGKTTVLTAIARGLAHTIGAAEGIKTTPPEFTESDIRYGSMASNLTLDLDVGGSALQILEDWTRLGTSATRPGELASEVDVHTEDIPRRGRLRQAQREALATPVHESGPHFIPDKVTFRSSAKNESSHLMSVFFSTTRAVTPVRTAHKSRAVQASAAAYIDVFVGRELGIQALAEWLKVLSTTAHERVDAVPILRALDEAVRRFLPGYLGLRVSSDDPPQLLIDRTALVTVCTDNLPQSARQQLVQVLRRMREHMDVNWPLKEIEELSPKKVAEAAALERKRVIESLLKTYMPGFKDLRGPLDMVPADILRVEYFDKFYETFGPQFEIDQLPESLSVSQLSDGERGILALVLDLTRRLAQANPGLRDPASESEAVILIDELELHLHPKWQRTILQSLTATFPKCQFIATTHSPQIIGEVPRDRTTRLLAGHTDVPRVAYGADSNWILDHVMEGSSETPQVRQLIAETENALDSNRLSEARRALETLRALVQGETGEIARLEGSLDSLELILIGDSSLESGDADD